jgi:peptide-methionine (S)-S-oxide reductase
MSQLEVATLGGGCFWCVEAVYASLQGVASVESGYMGGCVPSPTYQQVCTDTTGHAEVAQIQFDPAVTSFRQILEVFFSVHDPTTLNRQGEDVGSQYRSVIFYHSSEQERIARELIGELTERRAFRWPIVTGVVPASQFYKAEGYHQRYFRRNPDQPYCAMVIAPKVQKFCEKFSGKLKRE